MEFFPSAVLDEIRYLNTNLRELNGSLKGSAESSDNLQKKLIFWTKVMAVAVAVQVVVILIQTFR